ncbi:hypothetical protein J4230_03305 [Candidatus Woesearchaeota archaeon]|nr:hypothetical protein [Candidatus Woesearchaeota archaeon]
MSIKFKDYKDSNFKDIALCIEGLIGRVIKIDPLKRQRRMPAYSKNYTKTLVSKVKKNDG